MGAIALPSNIETEPNARPVVTMVATRDCVLAVDMLTSLSGEPDAVAAALHHVLEDAMRLTGARPHFLHVVHPEEAMALAPLLDGSGIEVEALGIFDRLHDPARTMVEDLSGAPIWPPMSKPDTWSAWGLPDADLAALFRDAAEFFRAAPWTVLSDGIPLTFQPREGSPRAGAVLDERDLIEYRLETAPSGELLDPDVRMWRDPFLDDMEYRLLRPYMDQVLPTLGEEDNIRAINGLRELTRSWLLWRDELIESGEDDGDRFGELLVGRQRGWMQKRRG